MFIYLIGLHLVKYATFLCTKSGWSDRLYVAMSRAKITIYQIIIQYTVINVSNHDLIRKIIINIIINNY